MKLKNIILTLGFFTILGACSSKEAYLTRQYSMRGPCFTWGGVEKGRRRADYYCREANFRLEGIYCNRQDKHKGRHHCHVGRNCLSVWR